MKNNRGITVLILVIIVAVIVVGVIILISSSTVKKLQNFTDEEEIGDGMNSDYTTDIISSKIELDEQGYVINNNCVIKIQDEYKVIIPVGYAVCKVNENGTANIITDINDFKLEVIKEINNGIVIMDKERNEFVWIPVKEGEYKRETNYSKTAVSEAAYSFSSALPEKINIPSNITKPAVDDSNYSTIVENIERYTIEKAGGFYISRYEAGKPEETETKVPVSKKDVEAWTNISYEEAIEISKNMNKTEWVNSGLITGIQWDAVMKYIDNKITRSGDTYLAKTRNEERHLGEKRKTGDNLKDEICNIYDLEGNVWEYTAEKTNYNVYTPYVYRGNSYLTYGSASYRNIGDGKANKDIGFRIMLYVM